MTERERAREKENGEKKERERKTTKRKSRSNRELVGFSFVLDDQIALLWFILIVVKKNIHTHTRIKRK